MVASLLLALLLAACGVQERQAEARGVAEGFFRAMQANDVDRASAFFAPGYLETRSTEGLKQDLQIITARLGDLRSYRLATARSRTDFIPPESGTYVTLEYEVRYARYPAWERFTIHKPFGRGEYKILNHTIESHGFLKE